MKITKELYEKTKKRVEREYTEILRNSWTTWRKSKTRRRRKWNWTYCKKRR